MLLISGGDYSSPTNSLAPLLPLCHAPGVQLLDTATPTTTPSPQPQSGSGSSRVVARTRRLWRSYSCHQFDPGRAGALVQWAGLGACYPMDHGRLGVAHGRPLPKFTDEEVFLANHPGADYTTQKRK